MAHTAGPWRAEEMRPVPFSTPVFHMIVSDSCEYGAHKIIASTWGGADIDTARMLAAAPELLAALKGMLVSWAHMDDSALQMQIDEDDDDNLPASHVKRARAAIAKAKGENL